jgi:UDP-glucuronate 4-epimerase
VTSAAGTRQQIPMRALVTGVAGFIGSHLAEALVNAGHAVRGVDCFTPYYELWRKQANLAPLAALRSFEAVEADLRTADLAALLEGVDVVFHLAGQPGVRLSWASGFRDYEEHNILVTQRLLEQAKGVGVRRFVFASSSSVYGNAPSYPTTEADVPRPHSPYGVTKLAAEHLCSLYAENWGVPTVSLRYFTVYGPRQRPDMAMHRFIDAALHGRPVTVFGDGEQVRDFTYVSDVVAANLAAAGGEVPPGTVLNVAGGSAITVNGVLDLLAQLTGRPLTVERQPAQPGDVLMTGGSVERARHAIDWQPDVALPAGLAEQVRWHQSLSLAQ